MLFVNIFPFLSAFYPYLQLNWQLGKAKSILTYGPTTNSKAKIKSKNIQVWPIYMSDYCFQTAFSHYTLLQSKDAKTYAFC